MKKIYPQGEERGYVDENQYILLLKRQGTALNNNMSHSDFSRNVWLINGEGKEVWRVFSDTDKKGLEFTWLSTTNTEYIIHRREKSTGMLERTFLLDINTGYAVPYPEERSKRAGPELKLITKYEDRIYLNEKDYILLGRESKRNVVRINGAGEVVWKITVPDKDDINRYDFIRTVDGKCYANIDGKWNYLIDVETGFATLVD